MTTSSLLSEILCLIFCENVLNIGFFYRNILYTFCVLLRKKFKHSSKIVIILIEFHLFRLILDYLKEKKRRILLQRPALVTELKVYTNL